jgi:hypothetical protein
MTPKTAQLSDLLGSIRGLTLDDLLTAWNELRNAVMGRGVGKPAHVSQLLYDTTGKEYIAFREWLASKPALLQVLQEIFGAPEHIERYRNVVALARREGIFVTTPKQMPKPETLVEVLQQAPLTDKDLREQANAPKDQLLPRALRPSLATPGFDYGDLAKAVIVGVVSTLLVRVIMKVVR